MAETFTPRFGLIQWGAPTDGPSRLEFDTAFSQLETLGAIDKQGTLAARPAAGVIGTYYWATDVPALFRDDGSAWYSVGSTGFDAIFTASGIGARPVTLNAPSGQTADLLQANVNAVTLAKITAAGSFDGNIFTGKSLSMVNATAGNVVIAGKGAAAQSAELLRLRDNADADMFKVSSAGVVTGPGFSVSAAGKPVFGATAMSSVTGTLFSGQGIAEVIGAAGGASTTFSDFALIQHAAGDSNAVLRRLGLHIMVGTAADAGSGSVYIESSAASFANPDLVLARGGSPILRLPASGSASLLQSLGLNVPSTIDVATTSAAIMTSNSTARGTQGTGNLYDRIAGAASMYWYSGGSHNATAGNAGGGSKIAELTNAGLYITNRLQLLTVNDVSLAQANPSFMIGSGGSTNLIIDDNEIMARNNGAVATLSLNADGGDVNISHASYTAVVPGKFSLQGHKVTIAASAPGSPATGDVWMDIS